MHGLRQLEDLAGEVLYGFAPTVFAACRPPAAIFVLRRHRRFHRRLRRLDPGERELVVALRRDL
jgi:hypothetical protein